jgi:RHS repeat-associated protein
VLGQRVRKTVNGTSTLFSYSEQGQLQGEYDQTGQAIQETVWLGSLPIAVLKPNASQTVDTFYVHADHLNTPRKVTRPSDNKPVWTWESEAFGNTLPNENPSNLGSFAYNLRFPGQYYDQETGLNYNYFRDYDSSNGRYTTSDPIGLAGGINTYAYVGGNPVNFTDPKGQSVGAVAGAEAGFFVCSPYCAAGGAVLGGLATTGAGIWIYNQVCPSETCDEMNKKDIENCSDNYSLWGYDTYAYQGCMQRARIRLDMCQRNGGTLPEGAPGKWNDSDVTGERTIHDK